MTQHIDRVELIGPGPAVTTAGPLPDPAPPAQPPEEDGLGCLRTARGNLPLAAIDVAATITGLASTTRLTQGFHNPYDEPLEATYIFPLPPRAAVTALRMEADDRVVDAVLRERGQARADYDAAVSQGRRASIAEEERPGVFTMRVGNIMPGERVSVRLTLAGELAYEDGTATFRFPLVVAPRYIPGTPLPGEQVGDGTQLDTDAVPDASRISPPVLLPGFPNPVALSVEVDIDPAGLPVTSAASSLHTVITDRDGDRLRVRLAPGERPNRDFVLRLAFAADAVRTSLAVLPDDAATGDDDSTGDNDSTGDEAGGGSAQGGTFALTILPPAGSGQARDRDVVIILDRSGSMGGWKMVAARRAAARIVDTLRGGDRFAVLAFDNWVETPPTLPSDTLVEASERNRFLAVEFLARVDARGGTAMLAPLRQAAALLGGGDATAGERERIVVLVTDGQVGNEDQLLRELASGFAGARVFTVGIDRAVNEGFLRRLAGPTGRCELVESQERLDEVMRHIHRRIDAPVVTGLRLAPADGPGTLAVDESSLCPRPLPDLFPGAPVVIRGRYTGTPTGTVTVTGGDGWRASAAATPSTDQSLAALWARALIRDLEDQYVATDHWADRAAIDALERRVVETSLRCRVLSRFTAFVAVDQRVVNEGGTRRRVTQPVDLPSGWEPQEPAAPGMVMAPAPLAAGAALAGAPVAYAAPPPGPLSPAPWSGQAVYRKAAPGRGGGRGLRPRPAARAADAAATSPGGGAGTLAEFVHRQLDELRQRAGDDAATRLAALRRLVAELAEGLPRWRAAGAPEPACAKLDGLRVELAAGDPGALERLWRHAVRTLEGVAATVGGGGRARRSFWKR